MGSALLFSSNANNWLLTENILDPNGIIVASARFDDTNPGEREGFYFYHYDMRRSTTAIVGADGKLQKGYSYDTFGAIEESGSKSFLNEVTFTGSVTDKSTGLQYMNSRFYDSSTGRFLTQDSYSGNPYDPWTQHLYSYCGNNPVNMVDPTGHDFIVVMLVVAAILLVGNIARECNVDKPRYEKDISSLTPNRTEKPAAPKRKPKGTFGAGGSLALEAEHKDSVTDIVAGPSSSILSVGITTGTKIKKTIHSEGSSEHPISVYYENINGNTTKSSAGIKLNSYSFKDELTGTTALTAGLSNFGMSFTAPVKGTNHTRGMYLNLTFEKATANLGFSDSYENDGIVTTDYTEININYATAMFAYVAAPAVAACGGGVAAGKMLVDILG